MVFFYVLLLCTFPVVLSFLICKNKDKLGGTPPPPGPPGLPIIGNLFQIDAKAPHLYFFELSKKYGPLMSLRLGLRPTLIVSSASLAKEALKTHDLEFAGRPSFLSWRRLSYNGLDLAFSNGPYWREIRKLCVVNLFNAKRVQTFRSVREEEVRRMIRKIQTKSASSDKLVNLSTLTMSFASSLICRIAFGKSYEDGKSSLDEATKFHRLVRESDNMFSSCFFSDYIPFTGWVDRLRGLLSRLDKNFEEFDGFYQQIIDDHMDPRRPKTEDQVEDIIDVMLRLMKENSYSINISHNHIKAVLMNIFLAGSETNASTLVWTMTALMKHPRVLQNVRKEIEHVCGEKSFVREEDIERLPYLRAVIKETWRMFPPVPLLVPRETIQRCKLNGSEIQPKTLVYINSWAIGRDPEAWEEPEKFQPERFLDSPIDYKGQDYEFLPFGAGRRMCPGLHIGAAAVELALANLLHQFNWELPAGMKREDVDTTAVPGITVHKKVPLKLVAKSRIPSSN